MDFNWKQEVESGNRSKFKQALYYTNTARIMGTTAGKLLNVYLRLQ